MARRSRASSARALDAVGIHFRRIELVVVLAGGLGAVHGDVGILQQRLRIQTVVRIGGDADADAQLVFVAVDFERCRRFRQQALGDFTQLVRIVVILDQRQELIAADTRDRVLFAQRLLHACRAGAQHVVASFMAEGIIDVLETIQIEKQDRNLVVLAFGMRQRLVQMLDEQEAVWQAGQFIVMRQMEDAALPLYGFQSRFPPDRC